MRSLARNSVIDEQELIAAAREELHPEEARAQLSREERGELTERILEMGTTWVAGRGVRTGWRTQPTPLPHRAASSSCLPAPHALPAARSAAS